MLAKFYSAKGLFSVAFAVKLFLAVFTLPSRQEGQRDFSLAETYASNDKKSIPLFVQQLDQTEGPRHSSLFYTSPTGHDREAEAGSGPLFGGREDDEDIHKSHRETHDAHLEYSNFKAFRDAEDEDQQLHRRGGGREGSSSVFESDLLSRDNESLFGDDLRPRLAEQEGEARDRISLTRKFIETTCHQNRGFQRNEQLNNTFLTYCFRYKLENLLSNDILDQIMHEDSRVCQRTLDEFIQLDETINQFDSLFTTLLSRYNCHNGYSVKWNCDDCKKAYKDWLCATHLPFYMNGERIKPCISFCERVEQRCPYLHPITREQYGGQPVFICRDPNIPFVPEITPDIPYSEPGRCYDLCHLSDNLTELVSDSLSKYDYDKCPDRGSIASEVRSESGGPAGDSKLPGLSAQDALDYSEIGGPDEDEENAVLLANSTGATGHTKVLIGVSERGRRVHVHSKKLDELREVLANYKNQAKTHRYHADHSSVVHSMSNELNHAS